MKTNYEQSTKKEKQREPPTQSHRPLRGAQSQAARQRKWAPTVYRWLWSSPAADRAYPTCISTALGTRQKKKKAKNREKGQIKKMFFKLPKNCIGKGSMFFSTIWTYSKTKSCSSSCFYNLDNNCYTKQNVIDCQAQSAFKERHLLSLPCQTTKYMTKGKIKDICFLFSYTHKTADKDKAYHISCKILYSPASHLDVTTLRVRPQWRHTGQGQLNYNLQTLWKHSKHLIKKRRRSPLFSLLINYFSLTEKQHKWDQLFLNTTNTRNKWNPTHVHTLLCNCAVVPTDILRPSKSMKQT